MSYKKQLMSDVSAMVLHGMMGQSPGVIMTTVAHDNWCNLLNRKGECNCNPTIEYRQQAATKK